MISMVVIDVFFLVDERCALIFVDVPPNYDEAMHRNQHLASTKPI